MCKWGTHKEVFVIRRNNPYIEDGWHPMNVDVCIAADVQKMNDLGIITIGCCCGHAQYEAGIGVELESRDLLDKHGYEYREPNNSNAYKYLKVINFNDEVAEMDGVFPIE